MVRNTAVSEAKARELSDQLGFRGFAVSTEKTADGYTKVVINTDQASIVVRQVDAESKDVFGQDLNAYTPHLLTLAAADTLSAADTAKITLEVAKHGIKLCFKSGADLATAEAADGEIIQYSTRWQNKGI